MYGACTLRMPFFEHLQTNSRILFILYHVLLQTESYVLLAVVLFEPSSTGMCVF